MKDELDAREAIGMERGMEQEKEQEKEHGIKSVIEVCKSLGASRDVAWTMLVEKFQLTRPETNRYMKKYW